jgi:hypothetical protein
MPILSEFITPRCRLGKVEFNQCHKQNENILSAQGFAPQQRRQTQMGGLPKILPEVSPFRIPRGEPAGRLGAVTALLEGEEPVLEKSGLRQENWQPGPIEGVLVEGTRYLPRGQLAPKDKKSGIRLAEAPHSYLGITRSYC